MCSYMKFYDDDVCFIDNKWKCHFQKIKDCMLKPRLFNKWNEEEHCASDHNYKELYAILGRCLLVKQSLYLSGRVLKRLGTIWNEVIKMISTM